MKIKNKFNEPVPNIKPILKSQFNFKKTGEIGTTMLDEGFRRMPKNSSSHSPERALIPKTMTSLKSKNTFNDLQAFQENKPTNNGDHSPKAPSLQNLIKNFQSDDFLPLPFISNNNI